jgi:hypothetical protein
VVSPSDDDLELLTHYAFKLLDSQRFRCGEEILTIIAMTAVQVSIPPCAIDRSETNFCLTGRLYYSDGRCRCLR